MTLNVKTMTDDELADEIVRIRDEIGERKDIQFQKENLKYVGACFVSQNCYSCPEKKSDYWNIYYMVLGLNEGRGVDVLCFETDKNGDVSVRKIHSYVHLLGKKISRNAFEKAAGKLVSTVANLVHISIQFD